MKNFSKSLICLSTLFVSLNSMSQTPSTTPATKPVITAPAPGADKSAATVKPALTSKKATPAPQATPVRDTAPGGGDGKVWVNTASKTYHCAGSKYYGKTKKGEYMLEADAKTKGNHADHQKACS